MLIVAVTLAVLAQSPAEAPVVLTSPPLQAPPCGDVKLATQFIDRQLLSVGLEVGFFTDWVVRSPERAYRLGELREAVRLIPEAQTLADRADGEFRLGTGFTVAGLIAEGLSLAVSVILLPLTVSGASSAVLVVFLVATLLGVTSGTVLSLVGSAFLHSAQQHGLEAVSQYNHGLTRLVLAGCDGPGAAPVLQVPLP